jgi:hypothetical protein
MGWSVAVDGDVTVVGAPGDGEQGFAAGSAYVYGHNGAAWVEEAMLVDPDGAPYDNFGSSVAVSGDAVLVGSPGDDPGGSAFVFRFDGKSWTQEAHLLASDGEVGDAFGHSVSIDGQSVVIGDPSNNNGNGVNAGAAYVYRFGCPPWLEVAKLLASDGASQDNFGDDVAISGNAAILGADNDDDLRGSAYVFTGLRGVDCNDNGTADACDLDAGTSDDIDGNGVPDECDCPCDLDGDGTVGITDFLDLLAAWGPNPGHPADLDADGFVGITDFLVLLGHWGPCPLFVDCNGNGVFDDIDLEQGTSPDCNQNAVPDECDLTAGTSPDCNDNGVPDECDFCVGTSTDCNYNTLPDECDVAGGTSPDVNGNGVPDECDFTADDCEDAVAATDGATPFLTIGATTDGPLTDCGGLPLLLIANDVWFVYTASCTGTVTFSLCNDADFDTILAIYDGGTCPSPTMINPLACSDDAPGCGQTSQVQMIGVQGTAYLVRVGSPQGGGFGILTVSCEPFP